MSTTRNATRFLITILAVAIACGTAQAAIAKAAKPMPRPFAKDYLNPAYTQKNGNSSGVWLPGTYSREHGKRLGK